MERDNLPRADALNDLWDHFALGQAPMNARTVEAGVAELLGRLQALGDPPEMDSARERVWQDLQQHPRWKEAGMTGSAMAANSRAVSPPRAPLSAWSVPGSRSLQAPVRRYAARWALTQLATAALVLLVLAGSLMAIGPLRSGIPRWLATLPAISGAPTTQAGVVTETLIDASNVSLPNGPATIYAMVTELQPGVSSTLGGQVGAMHYRVEQGAVLITHSGVEQIVHAGEQWGAPVNGEAAFENVGEEVARIVEVDVLDSIATSSIEANYASKFSDPQGGTDSFVIQAGGDLPGGTAQVVLERLSFPPGAALSPYIKDHFQWLGVAEGRVGVTLEGDRRPFRWDPGEERTFGLFESLPAIVPGTEMTLRNASDDPLILFRVTLTPSTDEESAASTPAAE